MGRSRARFAAAAAIAFAALTSAIASPLRTPQNGTPAVPAPVRKIFTSHCTECHSGASPSAGMSLEPARLPASILDKPSAAKPDFKIADSAAPERSYLLMKLRGAAGIAGSRMPLRANRLKDEDIQTLADWLAGLKPQAGDGEVKKKPEISAFQGVTLANLPTDTLIERGRYLFRVAHRFFPAVDTGWDTFFGLDGPGAILLGFGYGLSDRLSVTLGRTNQFQEWDLAFHYKALDQDESLPFGAAVHAGASLTTAALPGRTVFSSGNFRVHGELSLSRRLSESLSLLVVPAFVSNPDQRDAGRGGTFAVGLGGRWMFLDGLALIAEWVPVLAGYSAGANGWSFGLEKKIGGHVFQFFVLNAVGSTPGQYLPGPDLRDQDDHLRIGFNIYRAF
jgi:mono/diheme cytochrome c family protein